MEYFSRNSLDRRIENGKVFSRIVLTKNKKGVGKAGKNGGYITEATSIKGQSWVDCDALVCGRSSLAGTSLVTGTSIVNACNLRGRTIVRDGAYISQSELRDCNVSGHSSLVGCNLDGVTADNLIAKRLSFEGDIILRGGFESKVHLLAKEIVLGYYLFNLSPGVVDIIVTKRNLERGSKNEVIDRYIGDVGINARKVFDKHFVEGKRWRVLTRYSMEEVEKALSHVSGYQPRPTIDCAFQNLEQFTEHVKLSLILAGKPMRVHLSFTRPLKFYESLQFCSQSTASFPAKVDKNEVLASFNGRRYQRLILSQNIIPLIKKVQISSGSLTSPTF